MKDLVKIVVSINCYFLKLITKGTVGSYDKIKLWSHSKLKGK